MGRVRVEDTECAGVDGIEGWELVGRCREFSKEVRCVWYSGVGGCVGSAMVMRVISFVHGRISVKVVSNAQQMRVRIMVKNDRRFAGRKVMFMVVFWQRKWWNQFNSCVREY